MIFRYPWLQPAVVSWQVTGGRGFITTWLIHRSMQTVHIRSEKLQFVKDREWTGRQLGWRSLAGCTDSEQTWRKSVLRGHSDQWKVGSHSRTLHRRLHHWTSPLWQFGRAGDLHPIVSFESFMNSIDAKQNVVSSDKYQLAKRLTPCTYTLSCSTWEKQATTDQGSKGNKIKENWQIIWHLVFQKHFAPRILTSDNQLRLCSAESERSLQSTKHWQCIPSMPTSVDPNHKFWNQCA